MNIKWILLALSGLAFAACDKEPPTPENEEYVVFGHFYGFCVGEECIELYKLTNAKLYEWVEDDYPMAESFPLPGEFDPLDPALVAEVNFIKDLVPASLFNDPNTYFGNPDAYDQGGYVLEWNYDGKTGHWFFDTTTEDIPEYLHDLTAGIATAVSIIND